MPEVFGEAEEGHSSLPEIERFEDSGGLRFQRPPDFTGGEGQADDDTSWIHRGGEAHFGNQAFYSDFHNQGSEKGHNQVTLLPLGWHVFVQQRTANLRSLRPICH